MTPKTITFINILLFSLLLIWQSQSLRIRNHEISQNGKTSHQVSSLIAHGQNDAPVYDEQRYLVDLAGRQNTFKQKVTEIQNDFAGINMMLNDSSLTQGEKSIKLSQALADERDSLISAQQDLNLPYELKSCQCLNLTEQKKKELSAQLQKTKLKIDELQKSQIESNKHCESHDCPLLKQISNEIKMMKQYQTIMENTINSKCCQIVKYEYRDNLDVSNWHWGNTTQTDYQAKAFERQSTTDAKLQPCPYSMPWVNIQKNTCFSCTNDKPLFNLGTRTCEKDCTEFSKNSAFVLNLTTHTCAYNTNCPQGQYFDQTVRKCSIQPTYSNQSSCPPSRPFWDPSSYSCQSCPSQTPYFDSIMKKCRKCNTNQTWNQQSRTCESSQQCGDGYFYDSQTKRCVRQGNDTHSLCPPERPFWNEQTYSCDECQDDKPFYDKVRKTCRVCTEQEDFNQFTKECVPKTGNASCSSDQYYNNETNQCEKRGTTSMCPPSTPYWDAINFKCLKCPSQKPDFNQKTMQCEPCLLNHQWSSVYQYCVQNCPFGEAWNHEFKRCIKTNQTCPPKQAFNMHLNQCIEINCNQTNPFWNSTASQCQQCPAATVYNHVTGVCEKDSKSGNFSVCHEDRPLWNSENLRCEACPDGKSWNSETKTCTAQKATSNHHFMVQRTGVISHDSQKIEGHVYGNGKVLYQHHDLSYLKM